MASTGDYGGQCVIYVNNYFGKKLAVMTAAEAWNSSAVNQLSGPMSGSIACWKGGTGGYGHVGVVEFYNRNTKTMTFSDSNRKGDELVIRKTGITEKDMKGYFGSSYTFLGYVKFKD